MKPSENQAILTLTISNSQPILLEDFVHTFTSLAEDYRNSVSSNNSFAGEDAEIYIKDIRSGSIVADLIPIAISVTPLIIAEAERLALAIEVVERWKTRFSSILGGVIPDGSSKSDIKNWINGVEAIARDPNASSTLEAATFVDGKREVKAAFKFNTSDAQKVKTELENKLQQLEDKKQADYERVLMYFTRADITSSRVGKRSGERVVISDISDKPLALSYGSELAEQRIKHEIRDEESIFRKAFNVDVKVQMIGKKPAVYSVLNVHEVIDISDG